MTGLGEGLDGLTEAQTRAALVGFGWAKADADRAEAAPFLWTVCWLAGCGSVRAASSQAS